MNSTFIFIRTLCCLILCFFLACQSDYVEFKDNSKTPLLETTSYEHVVLDTMSIFTFTDKQVVKIVFDWKADAKGDVKVIGFSVDFSTSETKKESHKYYKFSVFEKDVYGTLGFGNIFLSECSSAIKDSCVPKKTYPFIEYDLTYSGLNFTDKYFNNYNFKEFDLDLPIGLAKLSFYQKSLFKSKRKYTLDFSTADDLSLKQLKSLESPEDYQLSLEKVFVEYSKELDNPFHKINPYILAFINGFLGMSSDFDFLLPDVLKPRFSLKTSFLSSMFFSNFSDEFPSSIRYEMLLSKNYYTRECPQGTGAAVINNVDLNNIFYHKGKAYPTSITQNVAYCDAEVFSINHFKLWHKVMK